MPAGDPVHHRLYAFTNGHKEDFWPYSTYSTTTYWMDGPLNTFNGIFTGYDFSEFVVYMLLGAGIIFLPKLWE